ncbi:hypothetical protein NQ317_016369 [Molorchus minor]|uniref:Anticodon-binding domain-containing protein n=1 Tax=Molorchus minor TaxID=1323400 RepID=A0ABQ9JBZ8_9CUCU|nr:hypothetical protein NQ317_016369 [Molorchus minor]
MLNKIKTLAERRGFIKKILPQCKSANFKIGPTGLLLQENLKMEWFYNIVVHKDLSVFLTNEDVSETFDYAKEVSLDKLPFGIAEIRKLKTKSSLINDGILSDKSLNFEKFCDDGDGIVLRSSIFISPTNSTQFFHQWQRQRRTWWRKLVHDIKYDRFGNLGAPSPGRYILTDTKSEKDDVQHCEILAKYPWDDQLVESINFNVTDRSYNAQQLQFKEGKKLIQAQSIYVMLSREPLFQGKPRELLRLHRKLAPYKISLAITGSSAAVVSELSDLALYLCRQLRTNNVPTLYLPSSYKNTLEAQYNQYDELGIPYNVVLNDNTLKNGIIQLRNRDTTLKEQVHVSDLVNYVEQLFKNY